MGVRGIILAGVHAWGDCVLEECVARPLLPVAARPLIWHVLSWIRDGGVVESVVCGNSDTTTLRRALGNGEALDTSLSYSEDVMPRGPAGCARDAAMDLEAETFVVVEGTIVPRIDLAALLDAHADSKAAVTLVVSQAESAKGRPHGGQEPAGIYVFTRAVLEGVPASGYQDIKETLIPSLYHRGQRVATHVVPANSIRRITDAASYLNMNMWAVQELAHGPGTPEGYVDINGAWLHGSAKVHPTARLVGPVLVGPGSVIESDAMIVGPTTIGGECSIGRQALISRSAVWERCRVGPGAVIDHSILTDQASVDAALVVRKTVCVSPRRSPKALFAQLAAWCRPVRSQASGRRGGVATTEFGSVPERLRGR
ncbi:MAG: NDP-sugar synthase [bacterium]|nr:NDP-sugar synthase [bacterium]